MRFSIKWKKYQDHGTSHSVVGIRVIAKLDDILVILVGVSVASMLFLTLLVLSMLVMVLFTRAKTAVRPVNAAAQIYG